MSSDLVTITNVDTHIAWVKPDASKEITHDMLTSNKRMAPILIAVFVVIRVNNLSNFAKDLFLPTVVNHALKIDNVAVAIFACLGALVLDLITFPIRLILCGIRIYNASKQPIHPLLDYLNHQKDVPQDLFNADVLHVQIDKKDGNVNSTEAKSVFLTNIPVRAQPVRPDKSLYEDCNTSSFPLN